MKNRPMSADGTNIERRKSRRFPVVVPIEVSWPGPNGMALKDLKGLTDLETIAIRSACPKSSISNDAMVKAFSEWANEHLEKWSASAEAGVMQAMHDTWPCF